MNPKNTRQKGRAFCACCSKTEDFNSDEVIFDYFGKEFTEYEYIIENLAIRPAPKKLLDLVPVHSTDISKSIYKILDEPVKCSDGHRKALLVERGPTKIPTILENYPCEALNKRPSPVMIHKPTKSPTEKGDFQKPDSPILRVHKTFEGADDFISLKNLPDNEEPKICGPCNPAIKNYNPCANYPYDQKPCGSCRLLTFPEKCKPIDFETISNVLDLRQSIKNKEYRTTKQILTDLCEASEQSLRIKPKVTKAPMPIEIKDTIETLRFKKPLPRFHTRTEKKLFHKPGVYFAGIKQDSIINEEDEYSNEQQFRTSTGSRRPSRQTDGQQRLSDQSGQRKMSGQSGRQRLSGQKPAVQIYESETTIEDINEYMYEKNATSMRDSSINYPKNNSSAQTDISKECPCPKKNKKNLKWKIIINKHSDCKC